MKTSDAPPTPPPRGAGARTRSAPRNPSPAEQALVDRFKAVLAAGDASESTGDDVDLDATETPPRVPARPEQTHNDREARQQSHDTSLDLSEPPALTVGALAGQSNPAVVAAASAAQGTGAAPAYHPAVVAQLLEKHVRQLLVSSSQTAARDAPQVMLNLTDAVLPGTQILLAQTETGWRLESQSSSPESYSTIKALAPQLRERFAERGLGELQLDVVLKSGDSEHSG